MIRRQPQIGMIRDDVAGGHAIGERLGEKEVIEANVGIPAGKRRSGTGQMAHAVSIDIVGAEHDRDGLPADAAPAEPDEQPQPQGQARHVQPFVGRERVALQVLPQESKYINLNPYCLHLWACLDGEAVPDFARGGKTI